MQDHSASKLTHQNRVKSREPRLWLSHGVPALLLLAFLSLLIALTLPVFLVAVGGALGSQSPAQAFGQFVSYALGMGTILVAVTLGAALFRGAVARFLRSAVPYVHRVSALFLVGSGAYLVHYWLFFARLF